MTFQSLRLMLAISGTSSLLALSGCGSEVAEAPNEACESIDDCTDDLVCTDGECVAQQPVAPVEPVEPTDPFCGDGILQDSENCDTAIPAGEPGACPTACPAQNACRPGKLFDEACDAECGYGDYITEAIDWDGCCPVGANPTTDTDCSFSACGDGVVDHREGEVCDDGEDNGSPLKCNLSCTGITAAECGNGFLEGGETCDQGADNGQPNKCNDRCNGITASICGNGVKEADEVCDHGAENGAPGKCNAGCTGTDVAVCGNGVVEHDEVCDDGALNNTPLHCNTTCGGITPSICGNGVTEAGEVCDDRGESAACNADCSLAVCGDGIRNATAGEACDEGAASSSCDANCEIPPRAEATAFRIDTLKIIDPQLSYDVSFLGCRKITNGGAGGKLPGGINAMIRDNLVASAPAPNENLFNLSLAILMRPLTQSFGATFDLDIAFPTCDTQLAGCTADDTKPVLLSQGTNLATTACLPLTEQAGRNPLYTGLNAPIGNCFVITEPLDVVTLTFSEPTAGNITLSLIDVIIAGKYSGAPATKITQGVLKGFLTESFADTVIINLPWPMNGRVLSDFLHGGKNAKTCDPDSVGDKDLHNGEPGWWFYLNFTATAADSWTE